MLTVNAVKGLHEVVATPGARTLLFMPLAHVFARFVEVLVVAAGAALGHTPDTKDLLPDLETFRPTFILSVPRVFEKVYNSSEQKAAAGGKGKIFHRAADAAIAYSRALDTPSGPSLALRLQHKVADALVLSKLRAALGGQVEWAISGGAPLGERLGPLLPRRRAQGARGLRPDRDHRAGDRQPARPDQDRHRRPAAAGHRGAHRRGRRDRGPGPARVRRLPRQPRGAPPRRSTTAGSAPATSGSLDDDGFLRITGRKKEIIVTAGGKNVAPAVLEDRLRAHPLVSQCVVVGDQRPFIGALVTLDAEGLPGWLAAHGLPTMDVASARTAPAVLAALDEAVARANEAVSRAESIRKYRVLEQDLTIANGYLTPKLSVKRNVVLKDFASEVDALYDGPQPAGDAAVGGTGRRRRSRPGRADRSRVRGRTRSGRRPGRRARLARRPGGARHIARTMRSGGTRPDPASTSIAARSPSSRSTGPRRRSSGR